MGKTDFKQLAVLLKEASAGNEKAFQEIYRQTSRPQLYYLQTILEAPEEAPDALQEVYFLLYKNMDKIDPPTILVAYLNRLSYYVGKNYTKIQRRRIKRRAGLEFLEDMEETETQERLCRIEREEKNEAVRKAVMKLPKEERAVVFMRYFQGLKHQEVALSLEMTVARSKHLQKLAHRHLIEILKAEGISSWQILFLLRGRETSGKKQDNKGTSGKLALGETKAAGAGMASAGGAGQAVLAAAALSILVVGGGSLSGVPKITHIHTYTEDAGVSARMDIQTKSTFPISKVEVKGENGTVGYADKTGKDKYSVRVMENGRYTVKIYSNNRRTDQVRETVDQIDSNVPEILSTDFTDTELIVTFAEDESGIDFDNLYCEDDTGTVLHPKRILSDENQVAFELPDRDTALYIWDRAGNQGKVLIQCQ